MATIRVVAAGVVVTVVDGQVSIEEAVEAATRVAAPVVTEVPDVAAAGDAGTSNGDANKNNGIGNGAAHADRDNGTSATPNATPVPVRRPATSATRRRPSLSWTDGELDRLRTLWPTHSATAIADELGRPHYTVKAKAKQLALKKTGPPAVISKSGTRAGPRFTPKSLSSAAVADPAPAPMHGPYLSQLVEAVPDLTPAHEDGVPAVPEPPFAACGTASLPDIDEDDTAVPAPASPDDAPVQSGDAMQLGSDAADDAHDDAGLIAGDISAIAAADDGGPVSLVDHRFGQCRFIVSNGGPVMYCGAPTGGVSSWCSEHAGRVFEKHGRRRAALPPKNENPGGNQVG